MTTSRRICLRRVTATALTLAAAAVLPLTATTGSFDGTDPFPHSILAPEPPVGAR